MSIINHKTNVNPVYRVIFSGSTGYADKNNETIPESFLTKSVNDNFNVSKPIPASDHQYTWIAGSLEQVQTTYLYLLDGGFYLEGGIISVAGTES